MTRRHSLAASFSLVLLALSSVSVNCGRTLRIVDIDGAPVEDVFVVYHTKAIASTRPLDVVRGQSPVDRPEPFRRAR